MYLPEYNCLFIHIPKAAGNSIKHAFGIGWKDHRDIGAHRELLGEEKLKEIYKFTFVRNPWDRIFSEYNYQRRKSQRPDTVRLYLTKPDGSIRTFPEWVRYALENPRDHEPKTWGGKPSDAVHRMSPQWDWISDQSGLAVDFVGRIENLRNDFQTIADHVGLKAPKLKRRNRKFHRHYSKHYDDETRQIVAAYYKKDIDEFGYEFEG